MGAAVLSLGAAAADVHLVTSGDQQQYEGSLQLTRVDSTAAPVTVPVRAPGIATIAPAEGVWQGKITCAECWAAPFFIREGTAPDVVVWPAARLHGSTNAQRVLRARFAPSSGEGPTGEVECEVSGGAYDCVLPREKLDIRFSSPGFAPDVRFGFEMPKKGLETRIDLVEGSSLSGLIEAARHVRASIEGTVVTLSTPDGTRQVYRTTANGKGFFQFKGLLPGEYSISIDKKGFTSPRTSVRIIENLAAELSAPLVVDTPKRLSVYLAPAADEQQHPWQVRLLSLNHRARSASVVSESRVSPIGEWVQQNLASGDYAIQVRRSNGALWMQQELAIDGEDVTRSLTVAGMHISGDLRLGEQPLAARVIFDGEAGAVLKADSDGTFSGDIPPGPMDRVVRIESDAPPVRRTVNAKIRQSESGDLRLSLLLPRTELSGRVVDERQEAQPGAIVMAAHDATNEVQQVFASRDGTFDLAGLEPGQYRVTADAFQHSSKPVLVTIEQNNVADVTIVLEKQARVVGIMTSGTLPVIQARIDAVPRDVTVPATLPEFVTNEQGKFLLDLPPGTQSFDLLAVHPAFDVVLTRAHVDNQKVLHLLTNQTGGTLTVETRDAQQWLLRHAGAEFPLAYVASQAGGAIDAARVTISRLPWGPYSLCSIRSGKCVDTYLPPLGTATVSMAEK